MGIRRVDELSTWKASEEGSSRAPSEDGDNTSNNEFVARNIGHQVLQASGDDWVDAKVVEAKKKDACKKQNEASLFGPSEPNIIPSRPGLLIRSGWMSRMQLS
ncbi:hypothetical protein NLG97_g3114 [Lecanicillium saksenae]|uniref:Uncharacterized protein n=1 Tax=Lecanicillium saksenae TaxID=468837 RepID=A0ACC1QYZ3_9HYPO|nr:hypothetical protein NLG97_g3114 [Lecanicillium saksenae]